MTTEEIAKAAKKKEEQKKKEAEKENKEKLKKEEQEKKAQFRKEVGSANKVGACPCMVSSLHFWVPFFQVLTKMNNNVLKASTLQVTKMASMLLDFGILKSSLFKHEI